jgi:PKD repeat protein
VPRSEFASAGVYTVTLTVENWSGKTDTKSLEVTVLSEDAPSLKVEFNAETRTVYKSEFRELDVTVTNNCAPDATSSVEYTYSWSLVSGPASIIGGALSSNINKIALSNSFSEAGTYII